MKATLALASVALLGLGASPAVLAQNLFINQATATPARSMFLLTSGSTTLTGWLSVDGVSSGALLNGDYSRAPDFAQLASESLHVIYVDHNSYASPSLDGVYQGFATVRGEVWQAKVATTAEFIPGTPSQFGAFAGDTIVHHTLSDLNDFRLSVSLPDNLADWLSPSLSFTAN